MSYLVIIVSIVSFIFGLISVLCWNFFLKFQEKRQYKANVKQMKLKFTQDINQQKANLYAENQKKRQELNEKNNLLANINKKKNNLLQQKETELNQKIKNNEELKGNLQNKYENYKIKEEGLLKQRNRVIKQLEEVAGISQEKAKDILFQNIEKQQTQKLNKMTNDKINETKTNLQIQVNDILARAIESYASQYVENKTAGKIELKDEGTKGKIIGKEGRNIKSFEEESGTDIIIEPDQPIIKISCFNPIRREIAIRALKKLIQDGRIQPQRIKETLAAEAKNIKGIAEKVGQETVNELRITNINPELVYYIGLLKFRTSYGQNILAHSIEVAKIAGAMATELKLNDEIAIRAGLLHDIGKAKDYEVDGLSHVTAGVELAQKFQESEIIINAIHAHHDDVPKNNVYSVLVSAADTISAARPGARDNIKEDYHKRMETIERVCGMLPGVKKVHAVKSGRLIRVIVDSVEINDFEAEKIATQIQQKLKIELKIPGEAKVEVIREFKTIKDI